jgi:hypothetical protein
MTKGIPWLAISLGLIGLLLTYLIYSSIIKENPICHDTKDIFQFYGIAVGIVGGGLTVWTLDKTNLMNGILLPLLIYVANIFLAFLYIQRVSPLPYQLRYTLVNNTNSDLTNIKIVGTKELVLEDLKMGRSISFAFSGYEENSVISFICIRNNVSDTVKLETSPTNGCGFRYDLVLKDINGRLVPGSLDSLQLN